MALAAEERADFMAFLRGLPVGAWDGPTLCGAWSVREVVAHVVSYEELALSRAAALFVSAGLSFETANARALARLAGLDPAELLDVLERNLRPRGLTAAFGGRIGLTDCVIHHQDIRRALSMPRTVPPDRLEAVLEFAMFAPPLPAKGNRRGLRLVATDLHWSFGSGPEVTGPGEALLMAVAGRAQALPELSGPGLPALARRVGG